MLAIEGLFYHLYNQVRIAMIWSPSSASLAQTTRIRCLAQFEVDAPLAGVLHGTGFGGHNARDPQRGKLQRPTSCCVASGAPCHHLFVAGIRSISSDFIGTTRGIDEDVVCAG